MRTVPVPTALPQVVVVFAPVIATGSCCRAYVIGAKKEILLLRVPATPAPDAKTRRAGYNVTVSKRRKLSFASLTSALEPISQIGN